MSELEGARKHQYLQYIMNFYSLQRKHETLAIQLEHSQAVTLYQIAIMDLQSVGVPLVIHCSEKSDMEKTYTHTVIQYINITIFMYT